MRHLISKFRRTQSIKPLYYTLNLIDKSDKTIIENLQIDDIFTLNCVMYKISWRDETYIKFGFCGFDYRMMKKRLRSR